MFDGQRLMNGGNNVPPMMQMNNSLHQQQHTNVQGGMFPYGMEHMEQPHNVPKLDQWDAHLLMDEKHLVSIFSKIRIYLFSSDQFFNCLVFLLYFQQQGWGAKWGN